MLSANDVYCDIKLAPDFLRNISPSDSDASSSRVYASSSKDFDNNDAQPARVRSQEEEKSCIVQEVDSKRPDSRILIVDDTEVNLVFLALSLNSIPGIEGRVDECFSG